MAPTYPKRLIEVDLPIKRIAEPKFAGTVARGSATCPCCGYTTSVVRVREQLKTRRGGSRDARLLCVVTAKTGETGRTFRLANPLDLKTVQLTLAALERYKKTRSPGLSSVPDEEISLNEIRRITESV